MTGVKYSIHTYWVGAWLTTTIMGEWIKLGTWIFRKKEIVAVQARSSRFTRKPQIYNSRPLVARHEGFCLWQKPECNTYRTSNKFLERSSL